MGMKSLAAILKPLSYAIVAVMGLFFGWHLSASAAVLPPGNINTCGELAAPGTYTLTSNIGSSGACITITSNSVVVDGAGFSINGTVSANNTAPSGQGYSFTLQYVTVLGAVSSFAGATDPARECDSIVGGVGGNISVSHATTSSILSQGGDGSGSCNAAGGGGGTLTVSYSNTGTLTSRGGFANFSGGGGSISVDRSVTSNISTQGTDGNEATGSGGAITISYSQVGTVNAGAGAGYAFTSAGSGGNIVINNSRVGVSVLSNGSGEEWAVGGGGNISISGNDINLSNTTLSALGGINNDGVRAPNGSLAITYSGSLTKTGATLSALSSLTINAPGPATYGPLAFVGGAFPILPGAVSSCGTLFGSGTYTLTGNIGSGGTCLVIATDGVVLDGAGFSINGGISGSGAGQTVDGLNNEASAPQAGKSFSLSDVTVTGAIVSNGGSGDANVGNASCSGKNGGNITISQATTSAVSSLGGTAGPCGNGPFAGNGGNITIDSGSFVGGDVSTGGGSSQQGAAGAGGPIAISGASSVTGSLSANGGGSSDGSGMPGGQISVIEDSSVSGDISTNGGSGLFTSAGNGGDIIISGTNVDISNKDISATGGACINCSPAAPGTLTVTYSGTLATASTTLSALSSLTVNAPGPVAYGPSAFAGGAFPMLPGGTITSASQCSTLVFPGPYYLADDLTGDCQITYDGIVIDGAGHVLDGSVTSSDGIDDAGFAATSGVGISLSNITVTGSVTSGRGGDSNGNGDPFGPKYGGESGSISISNSTTTDVTTGRGGSARGGDTYPGRSGSISIVASSVGNIRSGDVSDPSFSSGENGAVAGDIRLLSVFGGTVVAGSSLNGAAGGGGSVFATSSALVSVSAGAAGSNVGSFGFSPGGSVTLVDSAVSTFVSGGAGGFGWMGSDGGSVTMRNSSFGTFVSAGDGGDYPASCSANGAGGSVYLSGSVLDLRGKTISSGVGLPDDCNSAQPGSVSLSYGNVLTDATTYVYSRTGAFVVNGTSYVRDSISAGWDGVFNPQVFYFNDQQGNGGRAGDWADPLNWWSDLFYSVPAGAAPDSSSDVVVNDGSITQDTSGLARARTIVFNGNSKNAISVSVPDGATFRDTSANSTSTPTLPVSRSFRINLSSDEFLGFYYNGDMPIVVPGGSSFRPSDVSGEFGQWGYEEPFTAATKYADYINAHYGSGGAFASSTGAYQVSVTVQYSGPYFDLWVLDPGAYNGGYVSIEEGTPAVSSNGIGTILGRATFEGDSTENDSVVSIPLSARESDRYWRSIASSADGKRLAAVVVGGRIYTSADSGATWGPRDSDRDWLSVASSADGTRLAATVYGGQIYTSTDSGATWTPRESNRWWQSIASSADGTRLAAVVQNGRIYTSADSGATWEPRDSDRDWFSVASSADGTRLAAAVYGGQIYTSADSGATWEPRDSDRNWFSVASSADGTRLAAAENGGRIYVSADSGLTWTARDSSRNWISVASSADGTRLAAAENGGRIYVSTDSGLTWAARESNSTWMSIVSSADGTRLAATTNGGKIYVTESGQTRLFTSPASTTRNFLVEGGGYWAVVARGVAVDISGAVYDTATSVFRAVMDPISRLFGSFFTGGNAGGQVVPRISIATTTLAYDPDSPSANRTIKWRPLIDWDTSVSCLYSYDAFVTTHAVTCSDADASLPRPAAGQHSLYLRGTDARGGVTETGITYFYDNTAPYPIDSSDSPGSALVLDEATRPYYYLASSVSFPLLFSVDAELRGSATTTASSTSGGFSAGGFVNGQGHDLTLRNITVSGPILSNGATPGAAGGSISVFNSTTTSITANGANGAGNGGAGGVIIVTNSLASPIDSTITANGGSSTSCGNGGDAGQVTLTDSSYGLITTEPGDASVSGCPSQSRSSGTRRSVTVTGVHSSQAPSNGSGSQGSVVPATVRTAGTSETLREFRKATALSLSTVSLPVNFVGRLPALAPLPVFGGTGKGSFSFQGPVSRFLFQPLPQALTESLSGYPRLSAYLASVGVTNAQSLASIRLNPKAVSPEASRLPGLYSVSIDGKAPARTSLSSDASLMIFQQASASAGSRLMVSVPSRDGIAPIGFFDGKPLSFTKEGSASLTAPSAAGSYVLRSDASPISLVLKVAAPAGSNVKASSTGSPPRPTLWERVKGFFGRGKDN
jgi:hypothetical protein